LPIESLSEDEDSSDSEEEEEEDDLMGKRQTFIIYLLLSNPILISPLFFALNLRIRDFI